MMLKQQMKKKIFMKKYEQYEKKNGLNMINKVVPCLNL